MKNVLFLLCILTFTTTVFCQVFPRFGVKAGYGVSNQEWDYKDFDIEMKWDDYSSFAIAGFFDYPVAPFAKFFEIEGEVGYLQKGMKFHLPVSSFDQPSGTGEYVYLKNSLNYINFSVLAKLKYSFNLLTPYILAGPEVNYLISRNTESSMEEFYSYFKESSFSYSLGAGTELNMGIIDLLIEYRYAKDLTNNHGDFLIIKNYSHKLCAGIKF